MINNRCVFLILLLAAFSGSSASSEEPKRNRYNVLFIAIDDLNDWVGCLGGNPQAITPNFDRFAKDHAMVMNRAYCPSTVCGPTRSALPAKKLSLEPASKQKVVFMSNNIARVEGQGGFTPQWYTKQIPARSTQSRKMNQLLYMQIGDPALVPIQIQK